MTADRVAAHRIVAGYEDGVVCSGSGDCRTSPLRGAIRHDILDFYARVLASSLVTAQDSGAAMLDWRRALGDAA